MSSQIAMLTVILQLFTHICAQFNVYLRGKEKFPLIVLIFPKKGALITKSYLLKKIIKGRGLFFSIYAVLLPLCNSMILTELKLDTTH